METKYPNLLSPCQVGQVLFKNRMLAGPLGFCVPNSGGCIHEHNLEFYEIQATGGAARVTTNDYPVSGGMAPGGGLDFREPVDIEMEKSIQEYVRTMHRHHTLAFVEFTHSGFPVRDYVDPDEETATPNMRPLGKEMGDGKMPMPPMMGDGRTLAELSQKEIHQIIDDFASCCATAAQFGVDGVLLHGGHNKLIDQFRSLRHNKRTDEYGGSLENRARFCIELLEAIRSRCGDKLLLELRLSGDEGYPGGITIDETIEFLMYLQAYEETHQKNLYDLFHLSGGDHTTAAGNMATSSPAFYPNAYNRGFAKKIKAAGFKKPLVLINSINSPELAEDIIASGDAEFVCMARQLVVADPFFPRKVKEGRLDEINTCIRCHNCFDREECAVNPITQNRAYMQTKDVPLAKEKKKVAIVGGGIAGLKAAETAAARGHAVTLYEKEGYLGGLLRFSDTDNYKHDIRTFKNNMISRVTRQENVTVCLNTEATPELLEAQGFDAVIVAIGGEPVRPDIPGATGDNVMFSMDVYDHPERIGDSVIMLGGGIQACEIALHLAKAGKKVTIVGRRDKLAPHEVINNDVFHPIPAMKKMFRRFDPPVEIVTGCNCVEITQQGIRGVMVKTGEEISIQADTVVLAAGSRNRQAEAMKFNPCAKFVGMAGDCREPKKIKQAVAAGYYQAMDI